MLELRRKITTQFLSRNYEKSYYFLCPLHSYTLYLQNLDMRIILIICIVAWFRLFEHIYKFS